VLGSQADVPTWMPVTQVRQAHQRVPGCATLVCATSSGQERNPQVPRLALVNPA